MSVEIANLFTSPVLDHKTIFALRFQSASDESLNQNLDVFYSNLDASRNAIPSGEFEARKAIILFLLNRNEEAQEIFNKDNSLSSLLYGLSNLVSLDRRSESVKKVAQLKEAVLNSNDQGALLVAAIAFADLKQTESLRAVKEKIDQTSDEEGFVDYVNAYYAELDDRYQDAMDNFEALSEKECVMQGYALFHYAKLLDMWGFDEEAYDTYVKIETLGYTFEEALVNLGVLCEDKNEFGLALRYYNKALKINPTNGRALLYHSDAEACLNMQYDEGKLKQDIKTSEILAIPISDFELSVRSRNCLSKMGIFTLKDLITKTEQELLGYKNFGETSLKEIRAMLSKKGLHLGMTRVEEQPLAERIKINTQLFNQSSDYNLDQLDIAIEDLNLSYRTKSVLHKMGFESLRDITMRTGRDLEANESFSPACLQELNALLEERNLSYRPETSTSKPGYESAGSSLLEETAPVTIATEIATEQATETSTATATVAAPVAVEATKEDELYDDE